MDFVSTFSSSSFPHSSLTDSVRFSFIKGVHVFSFSMKGITEPAKETLDAVKQKTVRNFSKPSQKNQIIQRPHT